MKEVELLQLFAVESGGALRALPGARSLVAIVLRMHVDDVRSPTRSVANLEFHRTGHAVDPTALLDAPGTSP